MSPLPPQSPGGCLPWPPCPGPTFGGRVWSPQGYLAGTAGPGTYLSLMFSGRPQRVGESWFGTEENMDKSCLVLTLPVCKLGEPAPWFSPVHRDIETMNDSASSIIPPGGTDFHNWRGDCGRYSSVQGQACLPLGSRQKTRLGLGVTVSPGASEASLLGSLGRRMRDHTARVVTSAGSVDGEEWIWRWPLNGSWHPRIL